MNEFSTHWLSLREPIDRAARNKKLLAQLADFFDQNEHITIVDIAGGTGSTYRALQNTLPNKMTWHLVDNDPKLLESAKKQIPENNLNCHLHDLSISLEPVLAFKPDLITTTAFLDLVSEEWLEHFSQISASHQVPIYAALTYNGKKAISPLHPSLSPILC